MKENCLLFLKVWIQIQCWFHIMTTGNNYYLNPNPTERNKGLLLTKDTSQVMKNEKFPTKELFSKLLSLKTHQRFTSILTDTRYCPRSADCAEVHHEGHGSPAANRPAALLCHPHVCHHWSGVLQREAAPHLWTTARNTRWVLFHHWALVLQTEALYEVIEITQHKEGAVSIHYFRWDCLFQPLASSASNLNSSSTSIVATIASTNFAAKK